MATIELIHKRVGNDVKIALGLTDGGVAVDWTTVSKVRAVLVSDQQRVKMGECRISGPDATDPTRLLMLYPASQPEYLGVARLVVTVTYHGHVSTFDAPLLVFVPSTAEEGTGTVEVEAPVTLDPENNNLEISVTDVDTSVLEEAISDAQEAAAAANEAAEKATQAAGRNPYIGDNDHWYVWDAEEGEFVDTGVAATGPEGNPGAAAGFGTPQASVDGNTGTPSVEISSSGPDTAKVFSFQFHNLKGGKGDPGAAAGFGTPQASVDGGTGTPSVEVAVSGPDTAKVFTFTFHNLKGEKGDTTSAEWGTIAGNIQNQTDLIALISAIPGLEIVVVNTLPTASADTMSKIYLVPSADPESQNVKDEYITIDNGASAQTRYTWEQIGSTAIDLSDYVTDQEFATALANYVLSSSITDVLRYSAMSLTDAQKTQARTNIGATAPEVFWATYGTTTVAQIEAAYTAGKVVLCQYNNAIYTYSNKNEYYYYFGCITGQQSKYVRCAISNSAWANGTDTLQLQSQKVTSLSSSSTDTQYPSAKCVYDELQGKQGVIDSTHKLDYSLIDNQPTIPEFTDYTDAELQTAIDTAFAGL